jgi:hypothetical protein
MGSNETRLLKGHAEGDETMIAKKSTEAKLELTLLGTLLCLLSLRSLTHTSFYEWAVSILARVRSLWSWLGIDAGVVFYAIAVGIILYAVLLSILSEGPSPSRGLFILALLLFIPAALSFSELDWAPLIGIPRPKTDTSVQEALGLSAAIGCGLVLSGWYSEYAGLRDELAYRGIGSSSDAARSDLLFGITVALLSGFMAFLMGLTSLRMSDALGLPALLQPWQILALLVVGLAAAYASLWLPTTVPASLRRVRDVSFWAQDLRNKTADALYLQRTATTDELVSELPDLEEEVDIKRVTEILRLGDRCVHEKYVPTEGEASKAVRDSEEIIKKLNESQRVT